ncbi:MAG: DUF721 domain-containing protein [Acidobacteria bacterium]|nr:DUF721 domain-containing protein [Acidobacteriota bacterium]
MERAGQSLWSALRRVARPDKPLDLLVAVWPLMVGRRLAAHTRPVAWVKGRVDVAVDEPEWKSQLESMGKDVRAQVNRWWGSELVREVRFVPEKAKGIENRNSKLETRDSRPSAGGQRRSRPDATLPTTPENKLGAVLKELEPALKGIADADLRDLIARVAGQYLSKPFGSAPGKQGKQGKPFDSAPFGSAQGKQGKQGKK